jgi:hypothetical protein
MKSNKKQVSNNIKQITNNDKINYITRFICINLKKINLIPIIEQFEIEYSDDSDDEFVNINDIENE